MQIECIWVEKSVSNLRPVYTEKIASATRGFFRSEILCEPIYWLGEVISPYKHKQE